LTQYYYSEQTINDVNSITTTSRKGVAGTILIGGAVVAAAYVLAVLAFSALILALFGL
jgi:hypothetical protein